MIRKTVEIATPGSRLSVSHRQLVIARPDCKSATVPIEDIGVLVVDDRRASYTQAVFVELLAAGATVLVAGPDHLPAGMMLPLDANHVQTERHRAQADATEPAKKQIWRALVSAKLAQQGVVLEHFRGEPFGLPEMARRVRSGDPDNLEAKGAQRYWPALFGKDFRRDRSAEGVRYAPPRWIWQGTAICGVTGDMSRAVLRGWHAHNGVTLGNPRLGFVCTKQTPDGQDGLEGYYIEYDHDIGPEDRLRFSRGEEAPPFDPDKAPKLESAAWPQARLDKAMRNYTMEYVRSLIPEAIDLFGPADAQWLVGGAARLVGMHFYDECRALLGLDGAGAAGFSDFVMAMAQAGDESCAREAQGDAIHLTQGGWRLMRGVGPLHRASFDIWNELWAGCLAAHDRFLHWDARVAGERFEFAIAPRSAAPILGG